MNISNSPILRLRNRVLLGLVLALGCKKDEPAPPADPPTASEAKEDALPEKPQTPPKTGDAAGDGKGGLAALTKGLIDDVKATPADPLALVPSSAVLVAQMQLVPFKLVPGWEDARAKIESEMKGGEIAKLRGCQLDVDQLQSVVFAMFEGEHALAIVNGPGFGVVKNHECAVQELGDPEYALVEHEGGWRISLDHGDTYGYFLADDSVLIVDKEIDAEVATLRAGEGTSVASGPLKVTLDRVDKTRHAWFAGRVVGFLKSQLGASSMGEMHELWGTAHFEGDLSLGFGARFADAATATSTRDSAQKQLDEMKSMLPMIGVSPALASKITFAAEDDRFTVNVSMTEAEMTSIRAALKSFM